MRRNGPAQRRLSKGQQAIAIAMMIETEEGKRDGTAKRLSVGSTRSESYVNHAVAIRRYAPAQRRLSSARRASATSAMTGSQSPGERCRNGRALGYQADVSPRPQRQSAAVGSITQVAAP